VAELYLAGARTWTVNFDTGLFDERRIGLDHLAFRVADRHELQRWATHLEAKGVTHSGIIDTGFVNAWRASLGTLVGRDWMAGVVDLLAMIVSKRRSSSWHLIRMPFLGCVLVVASCSTHIASEAAPALLVRSGSIRTRGCRSDLRRQCGCHQCGPPQRQIRHQGRRPTKALI
jgi:hypothetical protein